MSSVCPSSSPYTTTQLHVDGFSWYLVFFEDLSRENSSSIKNLIRITGTLHENIRTFMIISRSALLRIGNILDKTCIENESTHIVFLVTF